MRLFDSVVNHVLINVLSFLTELINLILLYVIYKYSPQQMGRYKRMMWKMAVTDILFSSSLYWFFMPNLLLPLPAAETIGILRLFGPFGSRIAMTATCATCAATLLSVNDCCLYRLFLFYKMDAWLEGFVGIPGFLICVFAHILIVVILGVMIIFFAATHKDMMEYAVEANLTSYMKKVPPEMSMIAFDPRSIMTKVLFSVAFLFLLATCGVNIGLSTAVQRRIASVRSSLSKETYRMQKSLTIMLIGQTAIPFISITIPVMIYPVALFFDSFDSVDNPFVDWFVVVAVGGYPAINSLFCFYFMKPYRDAANRGFRRLLFWKPVVTVPITIIESSSHVESSMA